MIQIIRWIFGGSRKKTITKKEGKELMSFVLKTKELSAKQQVVEYDKIYHHVLQKLGYIGTFGDILKLNPKEINNIQEIWELHKLRNTLVHELRDMDERYILKQANNYKKILEKFIQQVSTK